MHEVSIAQALIHTVERTAREAGLERVTAINVELGEHAGVAPDALSFALQLASEGTVAEGAQLAWSGPGAETAAGQPEHSQHGHTHDGENEAEAMQRWSVRLAWIEGT